MSDSAPPSSKYRLSIRRPVTLAMPFLSLLVFGWKSYQDLSISLMPDISYPTLTVRTEYEGAAPADVEELMTRPLEERLSVVNAVVEVSSVSSAGRSEIILEFTWGTDMNVAMQDVRDAPDMYTPSQGVSKKPVILRYDPTLDPVLRVALTGRSHDSIGDLEEREKSLLQREESVRADAARLDAVEDRLSQLRSDLAERGRSLEETARQMETSGRAEARRFLLEARKRVEDAMALARLATDETTAKQARKLVEDGVRVEASALEKLEVAARKKGWKMRGRRGTETPAGAATSPPMVERPAPPSTLTESAAASEIDLRGMLGEDAEDAVVRALDEAVVADLASLRIIHGKGTGALRHRVGDVLRRDRRVASFSSPPAHQGGWGVTVAELQS